MKRIVVLLLALGALLAAWRLTGEIVPDEVAGHAATTPTADAIPATATPTDDADERVAAEQSAVAKALNEALTGNPNHDLLALIRKAQHGCPERDDTCLIHLTNSLAPAQQAQLRDILQRLPRLAARLGDMPMSTRQDFAERLAAIHAARVDVMGADNARLLFGKEEALLGYQATLDHFVRSEAAQLPLAQRLARAEAIRREALGPYWSSLTSGDSDRQQRYQAELALRLLDADSEPDQARIRQQLRTQYFGAEQAARLARLDNFDAEQRARANAYQHEKQQILARYAGQSDTASASRRDSELNALRQRMFPDSFQQ